MARQAALRRVVGSPTVMSEQLRHLAAMTHHPKTTVQVVPYANGAHPGMTGSLRDPRLPVPH